MSGETIISSASDCPSSSNIELVPSVAIEACEEDSSSPSSAAESQVEMEVISLVSIVDDDLERGRPIEIADASGGLAR